MLKLLGALLGVFFLSLCFAVATAPVPFGRYSDAATVKVYVSMGHGSGVYIGNGLVVTAAHIAEDADKDGKLEVQDDNGNKEPAHVVWFNKIADVGLIRLTNVSALPALRPASLACDEANAEVGDRLEIIGYPLALEKTHTWGRVANVVAHRALGQVNFIADISIAPGNSGGPVFDINGNVAGIAVAIAGAQLGMFPNIVGLSYIIPRSVICQELTAGHDKPKFKQET